MPGTRQLSRKHLWGYNRYQSYFQHFHRQHILTTIKLNRLNKKNAFNFDLLQALYDALEKAGNSDTRVIIITGASDFFSAGIDLNTLIGKDDSSSASAPDLENPARFRYWLNSVLHPFMSQIDKIEKPIIARVEGFCFGLGLELILACDFRFALESTKFSLPEAKIGIIPERSRTSSITPFSAINENPLLSSTNISAPNAPR